MQKLQNTVAQQQKQIESLVSSLQGVTAQLALEKPALEVAQKALNLQAQLQRPTWHCGSLPKTRNVRRCL